MVIGKSREDVQSTAEESIEVGKDIGLTIDCGETEYVMVRRGGNDRINLHAGKNNFENV